MINKIGYACINETLKPRTYRTCRLRSVYKNGIEYLRNIVIENLNLLYDILLWNKENGIELYRVPSDLIPFSTHPDILSDFLWRWQEDSAVIELLIKINKVIDKNKMRITMHPDQFTVINSINAKVVENSIDYLKYHAMLLDYIGGSDIVIHVGGVYGDKDLSIERFINAYLKLDSNVRKYLRIENDDKSYDINDVIDISIKTKMPVIFDYHHYRCLHKHNITDREIKAIINSWKRTGRNPKIHLSSGRESLYDRKHADFIAPEDLVEVENMFKTYFVDIMIEAKKKDIAVLTALNRFNRVGN